MVRFPSVGPTTSTDRGPPPFENLAVVEFVKRFGIVGPALVAAADMLHNLRTRLELIHCNYAAKNPCADEVATNQIEQLIKDCLAVPNFMKTGG